VEKGSHPNPLAPKFPSTLAQPPISLSLRSDTIRADGDRGTYSLAMTHEESERLTNQRSGYPESDIRVAGTMGALEPVCHSVVFRLAIPPTAADRAEGGVATAP
jgi:hypothetical protein